MLPHFKKVPPLFAKVIKAFRGINVTESYETGEVTSCTNITCDNYPALSSRRKRSIVNECAGTINGMGCHNGIFYTYYSDTDLYLNYNGCDYKFTDITNSNDVSAKRRFATLEKCIVIIPDNIMFFTDTLKFETIDIDMEYSYDDVLVKREKEGIAQSSIDLGSRFLCGYINTNSIWADRVTYTYSGRYNDFYFIAFDPSIKAGDVITIKMDVYSEKAPGDSAYVDYVAKMKEGITLKVKDIEKITHQSPNGDIEETTRLYFDDNSIDCGGYTDVGFRNIHIEKKMPQATDIVSFNNRVWAVSGNKIYASKLGQPEEWNDFSIDSYGTIPTASFSASSGSDGDFTAIICHGNFIYAFKENYIYKVYGDTPDEYRISGMSAPGVSGNPDTLCVCGTNLMYSSFGGICLLRDGYPRIISKKVGKIQPMCSASFDGKYYALCNEHNSKVIYIYDSAKDLWTLESCSGNADNICVAGENVYISDGKKIICLTGDSLGNTEKNVNWDFRLRFESGFFGPGTAVKGTASVRLEKNASFTVRCIYDDGTVSAPCGFCFDETPGGCAELRFPVKRELGFYLEVRGVGGFVLRSIKFNYYKSDME